MISPDIPSGMDRGYNPKIGLNVFKIRSPIIWYFCSYPDLPSFKCWIFYLVTDTGSRSQCWFLVFQPSFPVFWPHFYRKRQIRFFRRRCRKLIPSKNPTRPPSPNQTITIPEQFKNPYKWKIFINMWSIWLICWIFKKVFFFKSQNM